MAIPVLNKINKTIWPIRPVRDTKSDEIRKDVTRNPVNRYIGIYLLGILMLKSMRAIKPNQDIIKEINK
jgi:hypothetical protein